jgi:hypothetical protein
MNTSTQAFHAARDLLQLGARPLRCDGARQRRARRCGSSRKMAGVRSLRLQRCARSVQRRQLTCAAGRAARRPPAADHGQRAGRCGSPCWRHQAGRRGDPRHHAADPRRPGGPHRAWQGPPCDRRQGACPQVREPAGRLHAHRVGCAPSRLAPCESAASTRAFTPDGAPAPTIRCCCTSPPAPHPSPSWCCTPTRATRSATCRRCTGSACKPGDVHLEHLLAGLGQARLELLLRALERRRLRLHPQLARFTPRRCSTCWCTHGVTSLCAPPTVWRMLIQEDLAFQAGSSCAS